MVGKEEGEVREVSSGGVGKVSKEVMHSVIGRVAGG
jgi:hypothetical protein